MNIGPMGDGLIDPKDQAILRGIGKWLDVNGDSIYSSERTPLPVQAWGESTLKGTKIYLHVFNWPRNGKLVLGGLKSQIANVYLLADNRKNSLSSTQLNDSDIVIRVPLKAPDTADTVVVVKVKGAIKANPTRLLALDQSNVMRTFDGDLHGDGLRYGDGKAFRAYVFDWKDMNQWISWPLRLNAAAEFEVEVKYTTASKDNAGTYQVAVGDQELRAAIKPTANENESSIVSIGRIKLGPGKHELVIKPVEIKGGELMRLFYVSLTPVSHELR
jgi:hypothetical protein